MKKSWAGNCNQNKGDKAFQIWTNEVMRVPKNWLSSKFQKIFLGHSKDSHFVVALLSVSIWAMLDLFVAVGTYLSTSTKKYIWAQYAPYLIKEFALLVFASYFIPYLLIFAALYGGLRFFRPRSSLLVFIFFHLCTAFILIVRNPHLMEDFSLFNWGAKYIIGLAPLLSVLFATLFCVSFWPSKEIQNRLLFRRILWIFLPVYFLYFNFPLQPMWWRTTALSQESIGGAGHVILLGIDGMDPLIFKELVATGRYPEISNFVEKSEWYEGVYTEIARTEIALTGFMSNIPPHIASARVSMQSGEQSFIDAGAQPHIQKWLNNGGDIIARLSDSAFINFNRDKSLFREVKKPASQLFSLMGPYLLRNKLLFTYFNNPIFSWIAPEIFENAAFQQTYDSRIFLRTVRTDLKNLSKPAIYLSHLTVLHWPGSFPYPYYLHRGNSTNQSGQFSYSTIYDPFSVVVRDKKDYALFNKDLYRRGHEMVFDLYLEPLLRDLRISGQLEKSSIALYSDHSEAFFSRRVPDISHPSHGSWVPPLDNSYNAVMLIHRPNQKASAQVKGPTALHQGLARILDANFRSSSSQQIQDFESDWWPTKLFSHELWPLKAKRSKLQLSNDDVHLEADEVKGTLISKIRSLRWKEVNYSLFSTLRGYFWVCIDGKERCDLKNSWNLFREEYRTDFDAQILPDLIFDKIFFDQFASLLFEPKLKDKWQLAVYFVSNLNSYRNLNRSIVGLRKIWTSTELPAPIRRLLASQVVKLCTTNWKKILNKVQYSAVLQIVDQVKPGDFEDRGDLLAAMKCISDERNKTSEEWQKLIDHNSRPINDLKFLNNENAEWPFWEINSSSDQVLNLNPSLLPHTKVLEKIRNGSCKVDKIYDKVDCTY